MSENTGGEGVQGEGAANVEGGTGQKVAAPAKVDPAVKVDPAAKVDAPEKVATFDTAAFVAALDDDGKKVLAAKGWAHPNDIIKAYTNIEKLQGGDKLALPNAAEPEKLADWEGWKALGVPDNAEGYDIKRPELASGIEWDEPFEKTAREAGAMLKLTPFQMQGMVDLFAAKMNGQVAQGGAAIKAGVENTTQELKREWGNDFSKKYEFAQAAARHYGNIPENEMARLDSAFGSKGLVTMMADIGELLSEASLHQGKFAGFGTDATGAVAEIARREADPNFKKALMDRHHPDHKQSVKIMQDLRAKRDDGPRA